MKAVLAIDSFKGSLSTFGAEEAAARALEQSGVAARDIIRLPMSDGGEGFCEVIRAYTGSRTVTAAVHDPLGRTITASYLFDGTAAYIESASACGYTLISQEERNPLKTTSFGLGELIRDAVGRGARRIVIGMGGTSTCDAGIGMLQALGARFILKGGAVLKEREPALMKEILSMDTSSVDLRCATFEAWSDTEVPLTGAVRVFGRQKGLTDAMLAPAAEWMTSIASLFNDNGIAGGGAAGGIGSALAAVPAARITSGADSIIALSRLSGLEGVDLLITGEGRLDSQTLTGKLPARVAAAGRASGCRHILCLAGSISVDGPGCFDSTLCITPDGMPLDAAMQSASANLTATLRAWLSDHTF